MRRSLRGSFVKINNSMKIKPLDFVKTRAGNIALVTEVSNTQGMYTASVTFIGTPVNYDYNAWHAFENLEYIDNLPNILARGLQHPFSSGKDFTASIFKRETQ